MKVDQTNEKITEDQLAYMQKHILVDKIAGLTTPTVMQNPTFSSCIHCI